MQIAAAIFILLIGLLVLITRSVKDRAQENAVAAGEGVYFVKIAASGKGSVYHSMTCRKVNAWTEVTMGTARSKGYAPCATCGGRGRFERVVKTAPSQQQPALAIVKPIVPPLPKLSPIPEFSALDSIEASVAPLLLHAAQQNRILENHSASAFPYPVGSVLKTPDGHQVTVCPNGSVTDGYIVWESAGIFLRENEGDVAVFEPAEMKRG